MLLDSISNAWFLEAMSDVSLNFYANLSYIGHWLGRSTDNKVQGFLKIGFTMHRHAYFSEGVNCCDFEVEARIFGKNVAKSSHEARNPVRPIELSVVSDFLYRNFSDGPNSVFEEVQNQRF